MARVLKLTDGTNTLDFTTSTGFRSRMEYRPMFATPAGDGSIPPYVQQTIPVDVQCSSEDDLASTLQTFHLLQRRAAEYWMDPVQRTPVWFHEKLNNETGERRAFVKSLELHPDTDWHAPAPLVTDTFQAVVVVERHPYWERLTASSLATVASQTGPLKYTYVGAGSVNGDVGGRIEEIKFETSLAISKLWAGFRSGARHDATGAFDPTWECEDGTNEGVGDVSDVSEASASGGYAVQVAPSAWDWDAEEFHVCDIELRDVSSDESAHFGDFLWLLRARVTAGSWRVRLGFTTTYSSGGTAYSTPITVDDTDYNIYEGCAHAITLRDAQAIPFSLVTENYDQLFLVSLYAQRISGSGNLRLDCLYTIPIDEGFLYTELISGGSSSRRHWYYQSPHDRDVAVAAATITMTHLYEKLAISGGVGANFRVPPNTTGILVVMWSRGNSSVLTDTIGISGTYYPRWISLRGTE